MNSQLEQIIAHPVTDILTQKLTKSLGTMLSLPFFFSPAQNVRWLINSSEFEISKLKDLKSVYSLRYVLPEHAQLLNAAFKNLSFHVVCSLQKGLKFLVLEKIEP
jgi:hypothetical protein